MKQTNGKRILCIITAIILLCCGAAGIYASDYYHMDEAAVTAMADSNTVTVDPTDQLAIFGSANAEVGFIFYPGGKVEYTAYAPLMKMLAENGVLCLVPKMPLNLAVLDMNAAEDLPSQFPNVQTWYIGGHSLGGSMAASHAADSHDYAGLILLASYSTADLTDSGLEVLSIYGTKDGVLNMEKYNEYRSKLPADTVEYIMEGGNHAQFGSYGIQEGDGNALIPAMEQQLQTVNQILSFTGLSKSEASEYESEQYTFWMEREGKTALRSMLTLTPEEGTFYLSTNILSSRIISGTYTMENGTLICREWGGESAYYFDISDSGMTFRAQKSAPLYAHASAFDSNPNDQTEVPDGAIYSRLMICG